MDSFMWLKSVAQTVLGQNCEELEGCVFSRVVSGEWDVQYCYTSELNALRLFHWLITAGLENSRQVGFHSGIDENGDKIFWVWINI